MDKATVRVDFVTVSQITKNAEGCAFYHGNVQFRITIPLTKDSVRVEIPFPATESLDAAVAYSLFALATLGEQIAEDARQLSASIGYDLKDVHPDEP